MIPNSPLRRHESWIRSSIMWISAPSCKILALTTMYWKTGNSSSMLQLYSTPQAAWPVLLISLKVSSKTSNFSKGVNVVLICCNVSMAVVKCRSRTWEMLFRGVAIANVIDVDVVTSSTPSESKDQNFSSTPKNDRRAMSGCRFHL